MPWWPVAAALALLWAGAAPAPPLLVSAAVSLTEALTRGGEAFHRSTGRRVTFNFGASNVLARQVLHGAPVDVFVSADESQMNLVERAGALAPGSRRAVASNRLAVVALNGGGAPWSDPRPLASAAVRRVAMGDPQAVPAGVYARTWLVRIGLWHAVRPKVVPAGSVRGALAAVAGGAVDAGIVYLTDARVARGIRVVYEVTGDAAPVIVYPAAVVRRSRDRQGAQAFIDFLLGVEGQRVLATHGFSPPPPR